MKDEHKTKEDLICELDSMRQRIRELERLCHTGSDQKKHEGHLSHEQKMEVIGQMAGNVAHDFNNILTSIIGYASILQAESNDHQKGYVDQILRSAEKASHLTQGLLSLSRKQLLKAKLTNLNESVKSIEKLLSRIVGEERALKICFAKEPLTVLADEVQLEQALITLAMNARDAMPNGGTLTIETMSSELDQHYCETHGCGIPGKYAAISFTDTGIGLDEIKRERIFDPFFTTKGGREGTDLGLAVVYGIIKQHHGYISVHSHQEKGTTFTLFLPLISTAEKEKRPTRSSALAHGTGTILLAEDDTDVRNLSRWVLEEFGYTVIEASDGAEAIRTFTDNKDKIQLLVLDVVMPHKNGPEVFHEIRKLNPHIKALFMSGYPADLLCKEEVLEAGSHFVAKPVSPRNLLKEVNRALETER
ncbi:MAG TPA: ATP-binding protein [Thermodesulfovibrionales bacterium]|nr:ATP-binding protein [Thermodesulfovibrionales bacterium]